MTPVAVIVAFPAGVTSGAASLAKWPATQMTMKLTPSCAAAQITSAGQARMLPLARTTRFYWLWRTFRNATHPKGVSTLLRSGRAGQARTLMLERMIMHARNPK